jgi:hypothetical protein
MKKYLLLVTAIFLSLISYAQDFSVDGFSFSILRGDKCELIAAPDLEEVKVPAEVEYNDSKYRVVSISNDTFTNHKQIKKLWLPSTITSIGQAFSGCYISELHLDDIAAWCAIDFLTPMFATPFYSSNCAIFLGDEKIEKLTIPEGVVKINSSAFQYTKIKELYLPTSLEEIEESAFVYCKELERVHFSEGLKSIQESGFYACAKLDMVTLPESIETLGRIAFADCKSLSSLVFPQNLVNIGPQICDGDISLENIKFESSVSSIPRFAFRECEKLENVVLCEGTRTISEGAFQNCTHLKYIDLPSSIYSIGNDSFNGCVRIDYMISRSMYPPSCATDCFKGIDRDINVYVPTASVDGYKAANIWSEFNIIGSQDAGIESIQYDRSSVKAYVNSNGVVSQYPFKGFNIILLNDGSKLKTYIQ